jgi:S-adenosylmethionine-diacylglycerol 3-amino-3-carboxypropyl transferase
VKDCATLEQQRNIYYKYLGRVATLSNIIHYTRRIWCPLIAVPASQLNLFEGNIVRLACDNLFLRTHIAKDNYHYYGYLYGRYSPACCPRYLKPENFEFLKVSPGLPPTW